MIIISSLKNWLRKKQKPDDFAEIEQPDFGIFGGVMKSWKDPAYSLSADAYATIWRNDVVMQPILKWASKIGSMQLSVVGSGKRRDELQKIVDQTVAASDGIEHLVGAKIEGVRFLKNRAVWDPSIEMYVGDFRGCAGKRWKCGGVIYWRGWEADQEDPKKSIGRVEESFIGWDPADKKASEPGWYDRSDWTVFRPGAGTNPEGELEVAYQVFLLAEAARLLDKALRVYAERYSLPRELLKKMIDSVRPDEVTTVMRAAAQKIADSNGKHKGSMPLKDVVELVETKGTTFQFLTEYRSMLERRVHKLITGEDISSGGQESGDRGGRELGDKQLNSSAVAWGKKIADALTSDWLPFIEKMNDSLLSKLKKGEPKPYLSLRPPVEKQRITIAELKQVAEMKVPVNADYVYEVIGTDRPEDTEDIFDWENLTPDPVGMDPETGLPVPSDDTLSSTGENPQRKDREKPDTNIPADSTKKQNPQDDLRNADK